MSRRDTSPLNSATTQALLLVPEANRATPDVSNTTIGVSAPVGSAAIDLSRDDLSGTRLSHYELGARIGAGGMGQVFLARHVHLGKTFAIKFIASQLAGELEANRRFVKEFRALGQLSHPNIVAAVDAGAVDGLQYYVTEYLEGRDSLGWLAERGPMPIEAACDVARQAALGLAFAHKAGLTHRDIKPSNLFLQTNGNVKVLDFGLVCEEGAGGNLTAAGIVMGTLDFLSPEQAECTPQADQRSDIYSLGATLIYLLSGQVPFPDNQFPSAASKLRAHLLEPPPWLVNAKQDLPRPLFDVLNRMIAKQPADRFANCEQVAIALEAIANLNVLKGWLAGNSPRYESNPSKAPRIGVLGRNWLGWVAAAGLLATSVAGSCYWYPSGARLPNPATVSQPASDQNTSAERQERIAVPSEADAQHLASDDPPQFVPHKKQSDSAPRSTRESGSASARAANVDFGNRKSEQPGPTGVFSAPANSNH